MVWLEEAGFPQSSAAVQQWAYPREGDFSPGNNTSHACMPRTKRWLSQTCSKGMHVVCVCVCVCVYLCVSTSVFLAMLFTWMFCVFQMFFFWPSLQREHFCCLLTCVCACVCVHACVCMCVRVCICVCVLCVCGVCVMRETVFLHFAHHLGTHLSCLVWDCNFSLALSLSLSL